MTIKASLSIATRSPGFPFPGILSQQPNSPQYCPNMGLRARPGSAPPTTYLIDVSAGDKIPYKGG
jgi:hypothetical protein